MDDSLPERLKSLEADIRRLSKQRYVATALASFAILYVLSRDLARSGNSSFTLVTAKSLVAERISVQHNASEIVLEHDAHSNPMLKFYDSKRRNRINIGIHDDGGPNLVLYDADGHPRVGMKVGPGSSHVPSLLRFFGPGQEARLDIGMTDNDSGIVRFVDGRGREGLKMGQVPDGRSELVLENPDSERRIQLQTSVDSDPKFFLLGKDRQIYGLQRIGREEEVGSGTGKSLP